MLLSLIAFQGPPPEDAAEKAGHSLLLDASLSPALSAQLAQPVAGRRWEEAETILIAEIGRQPGSRGLLVLLGRIFFLDLKPLNSAVALTKAEKLGPLDADSRYLLAMAFVSLKLAVLARPYLEKLNEDNPANPQYLYWLGRLDFEAQNFESSAARYRKITETAPEFVRAWDGLGLSFQALGKYAEAGHCFREAVKRNRSHTDSSPWPPYDYAAMLLSLGLIEEAEPLLKEVVTSYPQFAPAHFKYGILQEKRGLPEMAIAELERTISLDRDETGPFPGLIRLYHTMGRIEDEKRAMLEFQARRRHAAEGKP